MTSGSNNFNDLTDNLLTKFRVFTDRSGIFISPLNIYKASRFIPP